MNTTKKDTLDVLLSLYWNIREDVSLIKLSRHAIDDLMDVAEILHDNQKMLKRTHEAEMEVYQSFLERKTGLDKV